MAWFVVFLALNAGCQAFRTEDSQQRLRNASGEVPKMVLDHEHPWRNHEDSMHAQSSGQRASHQRIELFQDEKENPSAKEILLAVGGGTGAGTGGSIEMDREIIRRMRYQDKLVLALMVAVYFVAIIFTASLAYRAACNNSSVKFYADPRVEPLMIDSDDMDDFLVTFMQPPKSIQLSVQGLMPIPALLANLVEGAIEWQGGYYRHIFSFSLDLSHFLVPSGLPEDGSDTAMAGLADQDLEELRRFLAENTNDLATVSMMKEVSWDNWEELATNIKQKIRQGGFEGLIHVSWKNSEMLTVYKNRTWANFLHMSVTRVLLGLSILGYLWYLPYMWLRQRGPQLQPRFKVNAGIAEYWNLISDKISERGFDT